MSVLKFCDTVHYVTSSIVNDALTQTDTLSVIQGARFGGAITAAGTITASGNVDITGFTKLGNTIGVKMKKLQKVIKAGIPNG